MKTDQIKNKEVVLELFFAVILFVLGMYRVNETVMPIILDDEFGYWSNSELLTGGDWTSITGNVAYYSYGYSLVLCLVRIVGYFRGNSWQIIYQTAVLFNVCFLAGSYLIAVKIAGRYMKNLNWVTRPAVCFVAALYPSGMLYTHMALSECTLTLVFWLFLYNMMYIIEKPKTGNHISFAFLTVYMYAVHQRTIGLVLVAVIMVLYLRLIKKNRLVHVCSFSVSTYLFYLLHCMIKMYIKSRNYLGMTDVSVKDCVNSIWKGKYLLLIGVLVAVMIWLYLLEKGKKKLAAVYLLCLAVACAAVLGWKLRAPGFDAGAEDLRLATNELSGQIGVLKNIFTKNGLIRLGTSIAGKWYYLATSTGLVICWGLMYLTMNAFGILSDSIGRIVKGFRHQQYIPNERLQEDFDRNIFLGGVFLSFAGAFMVSAIYKEGLYKVDDLINGRYVEYLIGIVLIYSVDRIIQNRHWIRYTLTFMVVYLLIGKYCQYVYDELQRTEYELIHAVVFGRIFWNYESPTGKIRLVAQYVVPLAVGFIAVAKLGASKFGNKKLDIIRILLALVIPVMAWNHIYTEIVDNYVVVRNEKQSGAMPEVAGWCDTLSGNAPIYFVSDGLSYKQAEVIQYMCQKKKIIFTDMSTVSFDEDAVFIINNSFLSDPVIAEKCEQVTTVGRYAVVINKNWKIMEKWQKFNR